MRAALFPQLLWLVGLFVSAWLPAEPPTSVRWMIRRDMPEVLQIEGDSFILPWGEKEFLARLLQRNCIGMVAEQGDKVVGFMIYELHQEKLELVNFAVAPELRRTGVGTKMMNKLMGMLSPQRRAEITLELGGESKGAQAFFVERGFRDLIPERSKKRIRFRLRDFSNATGMVKLEGEDFYERLDVSSKASAEQIEAAYRSTLALAGNNPSARALLTQAYRNLIDPQRRLQYDEGPIDQRKVNDMSGITVESYPRSRNLRVTTPRPDHENFYQRFGLPENEQLDADELTNRYLGLVTKFKGSPEALKRLGEAYTVLSRPESRGAYDRLAMVPAAQEVSEAVKKANPMLPDLYARVGIPLGAASERLNPYFDRALVEHAGDADAVQLILESRRTLTDEPRRQKYNQKRARLLAVDKAIYGGPADEGVLEFLERTKGVVGELRIGARGTDEYLSLLEEKTAALLAKPPSQTELRDLVRLTERLKTYDDSQKEVREPFVNFRQRLASALFNKVAQSAEAQVKARALYGNLTKEDSVEYLFQKRDEKPSSVKKVPEVAVKSAVAPLRAEAAAVAPLRAPTPRERVLAQLKPLLSNERDRRYGLLENPNRLGELMPLKLLGLASAGLWTSAFLFPQSIGAALLDNVHGPVGGMLSLATFGAAGIFGIYGTVEAIPAARHAYLRWRLARLDGHGIIPSACIAGYRALVHGR